MGSPKFPPDATARKGSPATARPRAAYLGSDGSGTEFWLSGPHVVSGAEGDTPTRHVCALARFNRRSRSRCRRTKGTQAGPRPRGTSAKKFVPPEHRVTPATTSAVPGTKRST